MHNNCSQTGSVKARFLKLTRLAWIKISKFSKLGLAGILKTSKKSFKWLTRLKWVKLLEAIKLVVEILKNIRSLLFYYGQTAHVVQVAG